MASITEIMARARRVVHATFGENATYSHPSSGVMEVPISVRWHNRIGIQGNLGDDGFTDLIEGVNRAIFNREELAEKNLVLYKGGRITLTNSLNDGVVLILDSMDPHVGTINEIWNVAVP